jgi:anti-sigma factor RsiW
MGRLNGQLCDRAREWASLRLDGELSELESALLAAHVERCVDCRAFTDDVDAATAALRDAQLEPLTAPVVLPRRTARARTRALQASAAAALVVTAAGLGSLFGVLSSGGNAKPAVRANRSPIVVAYDDTADSLRAIRREGLILEAKTIPRNRSLGDV